MSIRNNRFIALVLSILLPGLGHLYVGESKKGLVIFGSSVAFALFSFAVSGFNRVAAALALLLLWSSAAVDAYQSAKTSGRGRDFYYQKPYVVAMLLLVGPLALPLLWQSPNFSRAGRLVWTLVVTGAVLLFVATPYLVKLAAP